MDLPVGAERFAFPSQRPTSPPATPNSSRSRKTSAASHTSFLQNKRHGFINLGVSPPENIAPKGQGYQFSYTPPDRDHEASTDSSSSSSSDEDEDVNEQNDDDPIPEIETRSDASEQRQSVIRRSDETDLVVEEISDNDISYDDETELIQPDQTEDVESEAESAEAIPDQEDLLDALKNLKCGGQQEQEKAQEFEEQQRQRYNKKKKRWSRGGAKKRSHAQSIGSNESDNADIETLESFHQAGSSARRLRRRTFAREDGEMPNRTSLLLERPPAEIEELEDYEVLDVPPLLITDSDSDEEPSSSDEGGEDELVPDEDMMIPAWLMEVDSNPSRPSTAGSQTRIPVRSLATHDANVSSNVLPTR